MARDRSYGSGLNNTGMPRYTPTNVSQGQTGFHIRDDANEWSLNFGGLQLIGVPKGTIQQQQAWTVAKYGGTRPIGQLVRDVTGVGYDANNKFGVDPVGLAMAFTPAKFFKFNRIANSLRSASRASEEAFQASRPLIGGAPIRQGNVIRNLDQGVQNVSRSFEGAFEAVSDRASAADYGKAIAKIMRENNLRSVPNNVAAAGRGGRDVFSPVSEAVPAAMGARRVQASGRLPGSLYPSGVPAGGYVTAPNLATRRPVPVEYMRDGNLTLTGGLTEAQRAASDHIATLLNEAKTFRNLSAGMKPGGEYYFPRPYQPYNFSRTVGIGTGRLDPAAYQAEVMDFIRGKLASRRLIK